MPADTNMTMAAKWAGPCKADQTPGDMIIGERSDAVLQTATPGGMKMNVKDMQKMRGMVPPPK